MGVITLVLIAAGFQTAGTGPHLWVILAAGLAIGLGTYSGGWRIMRTLGKGIVDIDTPQGATSGAATTATILASSHLGFGLSTTHVATGAILGSGVGRAGAEVRWGLARKLVVAWLLTLPGAAIIGGLAALLAGTGAVGSGVLLVLLAGVCVVIWVVSRRNQVTSHNVTDSREVMVLASATPSTYPRGPAPGAAARTQDEEQEEDQERGLRSAMKIDWAALGIVAVVSIGMAVLFTVLLVRPASAPSRPRACGATGAAAAPPCWPAATRCSGLAGLLVLFGHLADRPPVPLSPWTAATPGPGPSRLVCCAVEGLRPPTRS